MTEHTHVREAALLYVDSETCVHHLLPTAASSQCPRPPAFRIDSYPTCDQHVVAVVVWMHERGNPDVVVRRVL